MYAEKFLITCERAGLNFKLNNNRAIDITGEGQSLITARRKLAKSKELTAEVTAILRARAAEEQEQATPQATQPEAFISEIEQPDTITACVNALRELPDALKSKLRNYIKACQKREIDIICDETSAGHKRVFLEPVNGEPITSDISDLFFEIYGFFECALIVNLGSRDKYIAYNLNRIAAQSNCDMFTAAYLATGIKRDLYIETYADYGFKPSHVPPEQIEPIEFKPVASNTKLRIFEVENQRGERFKFQVSCVDEVLPEALAGLRVISEFDFEAGEFRPPDASLITGDKSD